MLAGPGAGKTFCLIERIRHFVDVQGIPPERICAVTFTNRAAGEIAGRLREAIGDSADDVMRGTIHSLCVSLLREHGERIGVPRGFGIADETYQLQVLRRLGVYQWGSSRLNDFTRHRLAGAELHPNSVQLLAEYKSLAGAAKAARLRRPGDPRRPAPGTARCPCGGGGALGCDPGG